jgi:hypothetical protein
MARSQTLPHVPASISVALLAVTLSIVAVSGYYLGIQDAHRNLVVPFPNNPPQACTLEAKICPDGSSVGRTGPNCEFAACPEAARPNSTNTATYQDTLKRFTLSYPQTFHLNTPQNTTSGELELSFQNLNIPHGEVTDFSLLVKPGISDLPAVNEEVNSQHQKMGSQDFLFIASPNKEEPSITAFTIKNKSEYMIIFNGTNDRQNGLVQQIVSGLKFTK